MSQQKTFLFAGASSAIAKETSLLLQSKGHRVIGISTKSDHSNYDDLYEVINYDFGSFPAIEEKIDGLVYFPGTINLKPFGRLSAAEFRTDYEINALVDHASIVFISSVAASTGLPFHASISMAKGAIEALSKSLAAELAPNIRVNCIAPSLVNTPLGNKFLNTPEKIELMEKRNPMHKIGSALDIANAVSFLLLDESAWMTGQVMAIDGGMNHLKNG